MCQVEVFVPEFGEIAFLECFLLVPLWNCGELEQTGLPHEDGFYLEQVVAMMGNTCHWNAFRPCFEGVSVDTETEIACQGHEISRLPRTVAKFHSSEYGFGLLFEALGLQGACPRVNQKPGE